ncbi:MAG TPA: hypothetical protein VM557_07455 [Thermoanaerobaculia bacterium]|nr:hypothetical protein [Thermoanaerobaculia bacterium]
MLLSDSRRTPRYIPNPPCTARFGRETVTIRNFGKEGFQIEHEGPLAMREATFSWSPPTLEATMDVDAEVVWSRLLPSVEEPGQYRYRSGIRIASAARHSIEWMFDRMIATGRAFPDTESFDRKKEALEKKAELTASQRFLVPVEPHARLAPDDAKAILEASKRLDQNGDERSQWDALGNASLIGDRDRRERYKDVVAVWEYLDHKFDLEAIARIVRMSKR